MWCTLQAKAATSVGPAYVPPKCRFSDYENSRHYVTHRIQAEELRQAAHGPSRLHLDATAVLHGTALGKFTRGMQHFVAKLAVVQDAKAAEEIGTVKISEAPHNARVLTKPLQGGEFVYKRGRLLELEVTPPARRPGQAELRTRSTPSRRWPPRAPSRLGGSTGRHCGSRSPREA